MLLNKGMENENKDWKSKAVYKQVERHQHSRMNKGDKFIVAEDTDCKPFFPGPKL
jgi:hypothetical protein